MFEYLFFSVGAYSLSVLMVVTIVFLFAQLKQDNSIMDIAYGPTFAIATWITVLATSAMHPQMYLVAGLVTVWALRLSIRIGKKNWGKPEDARYAAWRTKWQQHGQLYFVLRSYIQINLLQGIIIVLVSLPMMLVISSNSAITTVLLYIGLIVFAVGLMTETIADWQLDFFIARKRAGVETNTLMKQGLFRYSRRPNYFGETLVWWGLALIALPYPYGAIAIVSPLLITFIVTKVTGPLLEEQFLEKYPTEYRAYMNETNYFFPWFPKKQAGHEANTL